MEVFFAQLINGISLGSIYALLATGLNLFLLVGGVIQFAYPHGVVLSMYICWIVLQRTGNNLALGILAAIGAGVGVSLLTEPLFRPLSRKGNLVPSFIATVAIAIVLILGIPNLIISTILTANLYIGGIISFSLLIWVFYYLTRPKVKEMFR